MNFKSIIAGGVKCITAVALSVVLSAGASTTASAQELTTGLVNQNGTWVYLTDGVVDTSVNGLVEYDGEWFYLQQGVLDTTLNGFVKYNGGVFYVANGRKCQEYSGLVQSGNDWYFVAEGQLQIFYTGLALYDGSWFLLEDGMLNKSFNGLYAYDGERFLVAGGQVLSSYSGLFENAGRWYYIADGMVTSYSGLTLYDGQWFYISWGMLDTSYAGYIKYDGSWFYINGGQIDTISQKAQYVTRAVEYVNTYWNELNQVLSYVNQYRAQAGSAPLVLDEDLCVAATIRSIEMADNNNMSHTRPDGTSCFTVLDEFSISSGYGGENIAYGYSTAASVSNAWYNSPGHYSNMINTNYKKIGVGLALSSGKTKYWTQLFTDGFVG